MSRKDNGEEAFIIMCKTAIALMVAIVAIGIIAIIANIAVGRNPEWSIPVRVVRGEE